MKNCREEEIRTAMLLGNQAIEQLHRAHVAVFGIGGVGGYTCEALARAGVGKLTLIDRDTVSLSNINRQLIALHSTVGRPKVEVMRERILDINPACEVTAIQAFYLPEHSADFPLEQYDYIVDAIDTVSAKLDLVRRATALNIPIISAMGAGNKLSAQAFTVTDLFKTTGCPLARVMRRELKKNGITHLKVVYSQETASPHHADFADLNDRAPASLPYVPGVAGLILAGEVIQEIIK